MRNLPYQSRLKLHIIMVIDCYWCNCHCFALPTYLKEWVFWGFFGYFVGVFCQKNSPTKLWQAGVLKIFGNIKSFCAFELKDNGKEHHFYINK